MHVYDLLALTCGSAMQEIIPKQKLLLKAI